MQRREKDLKCIEAALNYVGVVLQFYVNEYQDLHADLLADLVPKIEQARQVLPHFDYEGFTVESVRRDRSKAHDKCNNPSTQH